MSLIKYPNPILKKVCETVTLFDAELVELLKTLDSELAVHKGAALAANQIGVSKRIFVVCSEYSQMPKWIINPTIIDQRDLIRCQEGCLSIPGIKAWTKRYNDVIMSYQDENGVGRQYNAKGIHAQICQHEIDHLNGKLFVEDLDPIEKNKIANKLNKMRNKK